MVNLRKEQRLDDDHINVVTVSSIKNSGYPLTFNNCYEIM